MPRTTENTEPLNFLISADLKKMLQDYADAEHMKLAVACRILLKDALTRAARQNKASG